MPPPWRLKPKLRHGATARLGVPALAGGASVGSSALDILIFKVFANAPPPKGGTPSLDRRIIPLLAVIADGVILPHPLCFCAAHLFEVFRGAAPRPLCPKPHIAMMNRVVVNVIDGREEMPLRTHKPL